MSSSPPARVRCRQIAEGDLSAIADLLAAGFPARPRKYWTKGLEVLASLPIVDGCPRFGYMLESDGVAAGVILLITTQTGGQIRSNMSSWYVAPQARAFAALLIAQAMKLKHVTYLNISPIQHTWPIIEAQGYQRYSDGQFVCLPALGPGLKGARVRQITASDRRNASLPEHELLVAHAAAGCISLVCEAEGAAHPFVLLPKRVGMSPPGMMQLAWCRDTADFALCAGALGRFLLRRGALAVVLDANAAIPGLVGPYFKGKSPKYFKGADRPRLNDLAFTEAVLFGA